MRILIVCPGLGYGGAETQIIALAKGLKARGHQVAIQTLMTGTDRVQEVQRAGFEVWEGSKQRRLDIKLIRRIRERVHQWKADIVHGYLFDGNLYARLGVLGTAVPVICSERSSDYDLRSAQRVAHYLTRHLTTAIIANSWAGATLAKSMYPNRAKDIHVVWNGIDTAAVRQRITSINASNASLQLPENAKIAVFVGAIKPEKDLLLAIEVTRRLITKTKNWHVVFIGAPFPKTLPYALKELTQSQNYAIEVEEAFAALPESERVHRLGATSQVIEYVSQCDVLFSTSSREGFPNVVLEAMAAGTPVISTEYSDIKKILPLSWQVVSDRTPDLIADRILKAERESDLGAMQENWVEQHATLEIATNHLEQIYSQYIKS